MGAGIAVRAAMAGFPSQVLERDDAAVAAASERIASTAERAHVDVTGLIEVTSSWAVCARASFCIETVYEDMGAKREVLARLAGIVSDRTILATNTSSLSITSLAGGVTRPQRVVGMHFFNPVAVSLLCEVVVGTETDGETTRAVTTLAEKFGLEPIVVRDSPGFASSRLGLALGLEAIRMVEEEVASPRDIDLAMCKGYRHPMGPLRLTDLVGLDVRLAIAEHLASTLGPRFEPPRLLRDKVARGELGKKSGQGFYGWE